MKASFRPHKLKALRASKNLHQEELAKKTGVSRPTIQRLEAGLTDTPSLSTLQALAEFFALPVTVFFTDEAIPIK